MIVTHSLKNQSMPKIAIAWSELPTYAARLIRKGIEKYDGDVTVIGNPPKDAFSGMEDIIKGKIYWIEKNKIVTWQELGLTIPDLFFQSGWAVPSFNSLGREVKENGGKVVVMADTCWRNDFRQLLGAIIFRLYYCKIFDYAWVAGKSGEKTFKFFGMPPRKIFKGILGVDPKIFFYDRKNEGEREQTFLYVGRYLSIKGVDILAKAFGQFRRNNTGWRLVCVGAGSFEKTLSELDGVEVYPFSNANFISECYRNARFLVLPSRYEPWGMVVHEAVLCGCGLLLSSVVGSIMDFSTNDNAIIFKPGSVKALYEAMLRASHWDKNAFLRCQDVNMKLADQFGPDVWAQQFVEIIKRSQVE